VKRRTPRHVTQTFMLEFVKRHVDYLAQDRMRSVLDMSRFWQRIDGRLFYSMYTLQGTVERQLPKSSIQVTLMERLLAHTSWESGHAL